MNCLFCRIASGEIPCDKVYEDEKVIVFKDIGPQAPLHLLFVPKKHVRRLSEIDEPSMLSDLWKAVTKVTEMLGLEEKGYRIVINTGEEGGQTVDHLHWHLLAGRFLQWPPG